MAEESENKKRLRKTGGGVAYAVGLTTLSTPFTIAAANNGSFGQTLFFGAITAFFACAAAASYVSYKEELNDNLVEKLKAAGITPAQEVNQAPGAQPYQALHEPDDP